MGYKLSAYESRLLSLKEKRLREAEEDRQKQLEREEARRVSHMETERKQNKIKSDFFREWFTRWSTSPVTVKELSNIAVSVGLRPDLDPREPRSPRGKLTSLGRFLSKLEPPEESGLRKGKRSRRSGGVVYRLEVIPRHWPPETSGRPPGDGQAEAL